MITRLTYRKPLHIHHSTVSVPVLLTIGKWSLTILLVTNSQRDNFSHKPMLIVFDVFSETKSTFLNINQRI